MFSGGICPERERLLRKATEVVNLHNKTVSGITRNIGELGGAATNQTLLKISPFFRTKCVPHFLQRKRLGMNTGNTLKNTAADSGRKGPCVQHGRTLCVQTLNVGLDLYRSSLSRSLSGLCILPGSDKIHCWFKRKTRSKNLTGANAPKEHGGG